jgi:MBOAT, membrane-bound O-acyltransferase family
MAHTPLWTVAGFAAPVLLALAMFPVLARRGPVGLSATVLSCFVMLAAPWLIPADAPLLRFLAALSAAIVVIKVVDLVHDVRRGCAPSPREYVAFLFHPFTYVRRDLTRERKVPARDSARTLLAGTLASALCLWLFDSLFSVDWSAWPMLVEHASKAATFLLAICFGLTAGAALWRLCGGEARDFMDQPWAARTPADFWRRYNRNIQQFFEKHIFRSVGGRRAPHVAMLLVFGFSALMHEYIFSAAIGRVQGYQAVFFAVQGLAAALTAGVKARGWWALPSIAATLAFNLVSSVFFFASLHGVVPFYAGGLPQYLQGW